MKTLIQYISEGILDIGGTMADTEAQVTIINWLKNNCELHAFTDINNVVCKKSGDRYDVYDKTGEDEWNQIVKISNCNIDSDLKKLPQINLNMSNGGYTIINNATVLEEIDPKLIFDKIRGIENHNAFIFGDPDHPITVEYIRKFLKEFKKHSDVVPEISIMYDAMDYDLSSIDGDFHINKLIAPKHNVIAPALSLYSRCEFDVNILTIDASKADKFTKYCNMCDCKINELKIINGSSRNQIELGIRDSKIVNLKDILASQGESFIISANKSTLRKSGAYEAAPQVDILGNKISSGDIVLYPGFNSNIHFGNSGLTAVPSEVKKVTEETIQTSNKRVDGKLCLIIPEDAVDNKSTDIDVDIYGRKIKVGDVVAFCNSDNSYNSGAHIDLGEVEKIMRTIRVKGCRRMLYGQNIYLVDKQWLKKNDKAKKFKDLY